MLSLPRHALATTHCTSYCDGYPELTLARTGTSSVKAAVPTAWADPFAVCSACVLTMVRALILRSAAANYYTPLGYPVKTAGMRVAACVSLVGG